MSKEGSDPKGACRRIELNKLGNYNPMTVSSDLEIRPARLEEKRKLIENGLWEGKEKLRNADTFCLGNSPVFDGILRPLPKYQKDVPSSLVSV